MNVLRFLGCFLLPLLSIASPTAPTSSQQCQDFRQFMDAFQSTVNNLVHRLTLSCQMSSDCLGFHCHASGLATPLYLNLTLVPCADNNGPYLVFVRSSSSGKDVPRIIKNGERKVLLDDKVLRLYISPTIRWMDQNHIFIAASLEYCLFFFGTEIACRKQDISNRSIEVDGCASTGTQAPRTTPSSEKHTTLPPTEAPPTTHQPPHTTNGEVPTTSTSPECVGMEKLTEDLQESLEFLTCTENAQCTGFTCSGTIRRHQLSFNVTLYPCGDKPKLTYSGHGVTSTGKHMDLREDFYDGSSQKIIDFDGLTVTLITKVQKTDPTHIIISGHLDICDGDECFPRQTVVDNLMIAVKPCAHTEPPTTSASYTTHKMTGTIHSHPTTGNQPTTVLTMMPTKFPATTSNPECSGMEEVLEGVHNNLPGTNCKENQQCTGFNCAGKMKNGRLNFNITLNPCTERPKLIYSGHSPAGAHQEEFYDGDKHEILEVMGSKVLLSTQIKRMDKQHIKLSCDLVYCNTQGCRPHKTVVKDAVITVRSCDHIVGPSGSPAARKHQHKSESSDGSQHGISSGALAGIIISCVVIVAALLVGFWYWKKGHHLTRLRAAYYNDISMNDPLYDDFDPVDA